VITLSEKVNPAELARELRSSGAEEYVYLVQPDFVMELASFETGGEESGDLPESWPAEPEGEETEPETEETGDTGIGESEPEAGEPEEETGEPEEAEASQESKEEETGEPEEIETPQEPEEEEEQPEEIEEPQEEADDKEDEEEAPAEPEAAEEPEELEEPEEEEQAEPAAKPEKKAVPVIVPAKADEKKKGPEAKAAAKAEEKGKPPKLAPERAAKPAESKKPAKLAPEQQKPKEAQEPAVEQKAPAVQAKPDKKKVFAKRMSDVIFYALIAFILITTLLYSGKSNNGFHLFGYSGFTVLTGSMQREIPQGSLVITKEVDPKEIKIGDDITFIRSDSATVTHRVVDIYENYEESGELAFLTQGLENLEPDPDVVFEGNIIGVVKFSIPELGFFLTYVADNIGLVFILLGGILVATIAFSKILSTNRKEKQDAGETGS